VGGLVEVETVVEKKKTNTYKQVFDKNNLVELLYPQVNLIPNFCLEA
jgi:hypothetical protein